MRFMLLRMPRGYEATAPGARLSAETDEKMARYDEELQRAGVLLARDGLHPRSSGARVSFVGGKPRISEGPFPGEKDVVDGYWMIETRSRDEAIEWAARCPAADEETIEVRQVEETPRVLERAAGRPRGR